MNAHAAPPTGIRNRLSQLELLRPFLASQSTVLHRAARGSGWIFGLRAVEKLGSLLRTLVLARLLSPADFGLFGIVVVAVNALDLLTIYGIKAALIQKQNETRDDVDTAWTALLVQAIFNASVLFAAAPWIASFFHQPAVVSIIRVFGLALLLEGFVNIGTVYFDKELQFHKQFAFVLSGTLADVAVSIGFALVMRTVWALVVGAIAGKLVRVVLSYVLHRYRPRLRFASDSFRRLLAYGFWMWLSTALQFVLFQGDNIFVGRVLGARALGLYVVAYSVGTITRTDIGIVLQRVMFPSFSLMQSDDVQLKAAYLKVSRALTLVAFPLSAGIALAAPAFVSAVLGPAWRPAIPVLQVLAAVGLFSALLGNAGTLLWAVGSPKHATYSEFVFLALAASFIYPAARVWGLTGVALAVAIGSAAGWIYAEAMVARRLAIRFGDIAGSAKSNLFAAAAMSVVVFLLRNLILRLNPWLALATMCVTGACTYGSAVFVLRGAARGPKRLESPIAAAAVAEQRHMP